MVGIVALSVLRHVFKPVLIDLIEVPSSERHVHDD